MHNQQLDFMIIGAQKAGTTWLWDKLKRHPGTSLPHKKEIHFFGGVENFRKGEDWYVDHFNGIDRDKIVGEASTSYFYDYMPYWHNESFELAFDESLPPIPELITKKFPEIKVIVSLRDPVERAFSAYRHWMKKKSFSPFAGLKTVALMDPRIRIVEYGLYAKYLEMWMSYVPADRIFIVIFEEDIVQRADETIKELFRFLKLDPDVKLKEVHEVVHKSWNWNRIVLEYYASQFTRFLGGRISNYFANLLTIFNFSPFNETDLQFLRSIYLPEKVQLEQLTGRNLDCWSYGQNKR